MTTPTEANARLLIGVLAKHFPTGATCEDLRRRFEKSTSLARQSFYDALRFAKQQGWFVGGGQNQVYSLNPDNSWKAPLASAGDVGERLEKTQLEKLQLDNDRLEYLVDLQTGRIEGLEGELGLLRDWTGSDANGEANVALSSLVRIVGNSTASTRQRLRAAAAVLGYKVHDNGVTEFVKRFLESVCASTDIAIDYKIVAGETLRRHEAARIVPPTERPPARVDNVEEPQDLAALVARRRAQGERMVAEAMERERAVLEAQGRARKARQQGNGQGE